MGADYMLIPLMAAEQFGVNSLARAMAIILPVNTIGQTWFPYFVAMLREASRNYRSRWIRFSHWPWWAPSPSLCCPRRGVQMRHFVYKTLDELQRGAERLGAAHVRFEADPERPWPILARPVEVGGYAAGNSLAIHPMEGCDGTGMAEPDELTVAAL